MKKQLVMPQISSKAFALLSTNKSIQQRAEEYEISLKRTLYRSIIDPLVDKVESLKDKIYAAEDFNLNTDLNAGIKALTKEDCEKRFISAIELKWELKLTELELEAKKATFEEYFAQ